MEGGADIKVSRKQVLGLWSQSANDLNACLVDDNVFQSKPFSKTIICFYHNSRLKT